MKPIRTIATAALALFASACAGAGSGSLGPVGGAPPTSSPTEGPTGGPGPTTPSPGATPSPGRTATFEVWFAYGDRLFVTRRTEPFDPGVARQALTALLAGPTEAERAAGVTTAIPAGTRLLDVFLADGVLTVDLSAEFEAPGGSLEERMRLAQVVHTATQFRTVEGVLFEVEGRPVEAFGSHGVVLDGPQTREDYQDLFPLILVESPLIGETVPNPVTVSGVANVFEATVSLRVLDANGREVARTFTTATCGTGCWGDYSVAVDYRVDSEQPGVIEVFESSAEDGSPLHMVRIPVTLTP
jgi:hypothetical protein